MGQIPLYQNDPRWQNQTLGFGQTETIGKFGCLLVGLAMVINHFGGDETPATLNEKMKQVDGFQGPWVKAFKISAAYPQVRYQKHLESHNQTAPLDQIDAALAAGSLALVRVDYSPAAGMQSHWTLIHKKQGDSYLIWDPYHNPDEPKTLNGRYGFAGTPDQIIQEAILFGRGALPPTPPAEETAAPKKTTTAKKPAPQPTPVEETAVGDDDEQIVVRPTVGALTLRKQPRITPDNIVKYLSLSDKLLVLHTARTVKSRLGKHGQWIKVRDIEGDTGYVAAWYVTKTADPGFGVQEDSEATPTPPTKLVVKTTAGAVSLRSAPRVANETLIKYLPFGTELRVIESDGGDKIGRHGQWLNVQTLAGQTGYVAAWFVTKKTT